MKKFYNKIYVVILERKLSSLMKTKQKQLKLQDKGNKPKRACPPTDEEINILYNRNVLGNSEYKKL
jgi:hypothetical protein